MSAAIPVKIAVVNAKMVVLNASAVYGSIAS
jgi:hypothetical protein